MEDLNWKKSNLEKKKQVLPSGNEKYPAVPRYESADYLNDLWTRLLLTLAYKSCECGP